MPRGVKHASEEERLAAVKAAKKRYFLARRDRCDESQKKYYATNKEKKKAASLAWREANKEKWTAAQRDFYKNNPDKWKAYRKKFYEANRGKLIEAQRRRALVIKGPDWLTDADRAEIEGLYHFCRVFPGYEVDHIIPLNGKRVSGLHVPSNLQILTMRANRSKLNYYEV